MTYVRTYVHMNVRTHSQISSLQTEWPGRRVSPLWAPSLLRHSALTGACLWPAPASPCLSPRETTSSRLKWLQLPTPGRGLGLRKVGGEWREKGGGKEGVEKGGGVEREGMGGEGKEDFLKPSTLPRQRGRGE